MKFLSYACLFPLAALWTPCASAEGGNGSLDFEQRINGKVVLKTIEPVRARLQDLSAVFFARHDVVAYGVILTPDGYIATKASEFESHKGLLIRIGSSKYESFQVVGTDPATDIALVKVDAAGLPAPGPVSSDVPLGTLVVSNGSTTRISRRPQLGTISAARRPIPNKDTVYLGVVFGESCSFQEVVKDGPAFQAGALAGDRIVALDGTPVSTLEDISPILSKKAIGEKLKLRVRREDREISYTVTLGSRRKALGDPGSGNVQRRNQRRVQQTARRFSDGSPARHSLPVYADGRTAPQPQGGIDRHEYRQSEPGGKLRPADRCGAGERATHSEKRPGT